MGKPRRKYYYEVEEIIDKRYNIFGLCEFLVKWKGYPSSQNTWEPKKNLSNVTWMIKEFESARGRKNVRKLKKGKLIGEFPDVPKKVIKIKTINKFRYCKVKWKKRRNNELPIPSYIKYETVKEKFPYLLLDFIEHHVHLADDTQKKIVFDIKNDEEENSIKDKNQK